MRRCGWLVAAMAVGLIWLAGCAMPTMAPQGNVQTQVVVKETQVVTTKEAVKASATAVPAAPATRAPQATSAPAQAVTAAPPATLPPPPPTAAVTSAPTSAAATPAPPVPTPVVERHVVELEWPPRMRLGDSDLVRLALIPFQDGYVVTTEFPEHQTVTTTVAVARPGGYDLAAVARLDGVGFDLEPGGEQVQGLPLDTPVTWRWTLTPHSGGQHRLALTLALRWTPPPGNPQAAQETRIYSKGFEVQVTSFLGLTTRQATATGFAGLLFGTTLSLPLTAYLLRPRRPFARTRTLAPNAALVIEPHPAFSLSAEELALLRALFGRYSRLVLEAEFRSGYSGARTVLAQPVRADGRADAHTIIKLGELASIRREYENYETFVKDTLPPITARIQEPPVVVSGAGGKAALRYTFIAEPGRKPISLREALLADPDPALLAKLYDTFGPNWWMQRRPYTFRLGQEYDRMLPAHYVLAPAEGNAAGMLDGRRGPSETGSMAVGSLVGVRNFGVVERRQDGRSLALVGQTRPGQAPLRLRWLSLKPPEGARAARVVATRDRLLRELVAGLDLLGLPDPLGRLPGLLAESVAGTQSTIHGDLNLENVLVGPGGFVWLIDFAQTRDGHPLFDFAHLEAQLIAHVIAPQIPTPAAYLELLRTEPGSQPTPPAYVLRFMLRSIALRSLFNPSQPREYDLVLCLACLGALKHANLDRHQRHLLYLTAAHVAQGL